MFLIFFSCTSGSFLPQLICSDLSRTSDLWPLCADLRLTANINVCFKLTWICCVSWWSWSVLLPAHTGGSATWALLPASDGEPSVTQETVSTLQIQQIYLHLYRRHMNENQVPAASQHTEEHKGTSSQTSATLKPVHRWCFWFLQPESHSFTSTHQETKDLSATWLKFTCWCFVHVVTSTESH